MPSKVAARQTPAYQVTSLLARGLTPYTARGYPQPKNGRLPNRQQLPLRASLSTRKNNAHDKRREDLP